MESSALSAHLEQQYRVEIERVVAIESVYHVVLRDGSGWIARPFPAERPVEAAQRDADVLMFVESHQFPAERCVDGQSVSVLDDQAILVTRFVPGTNGRGNSTPELFHTLGDLLGQLQTLPGSNDSVAWPAGSWHHLSPAGGRREEDAAALEPPMADAKYAPLRDELAGIDLLDRLPEALHHPDFCSANAMLTSDGPVLVDWTGAGRAPRIAALGVLLASVETHLGLVDAVVDGYRKHVDLEADELDRLTGAVRAFGVILDCWMGVHYAAMLPHILQGLPAKRAQAEAIASRAQAAFRARS